MKKITDLTSKDFPNVNPEKFDEWKSTILEHKKAFIYLPLIATAVPMLAYFGGAILGIIGIIIVSLYMFAYIYPLAFKSKRLLKEMGITNADIKNKCNESL